jgi:hypothetical protein
MQDVNSTGTDYASLTQKINKTYLTILKLISGALVGGAKYSDIYVTSDNEDDDISRRNENITNNTDISLLVRDCLQGPLQAPFKY